MTVKELIGELQKLTEEEQDMEVVLATAEDEFDDSIILNGDGVDVSTRHIDDTGDDLVVLSPD